MSNLKKILALVLALVMSFSLVTVSSAAFDAFDDADEITPKYEEAVEVLSALGVFNGRTETDFDPQGTITRAEVAAIIYRVVTGDVKNKQTYIYSDYNKFDDVASTAWYAGYVNFCANAELIKGVGNNKFAPEANVTGYQALAMILRAVGYDKEGEFTGPNWQVQTAARAQKLGITKAVDEVTLGTAATREVVAELLLRSILVPQVTWNILGYNDKDSIIDGELNDSIGEETFGLWFDDENIYNLDKWGRPAMYWFVYDTKLCPIEIPYEVRYETAQTECQVAADLGVNKETTLFAFVNNGENNATYTFQPTDTVGVIGAQGRVTEIYDLGTHYRAVMIDTFLAMVTDVTPAKYDAKNHLVRPAVAELMVFDETPGEVYLTSATNFTYAIGDLFLVNAYTEDFDDLDVATKKDSLVTTLDTFVARDAFVTPETVVGAQTYIWKNAAKHTVGTETYDDAHTYMVPDAAGETALVNFLWVFDSFGNLIGSFDIPETYTYAILKDVIWNVGRPGYATATLIDAATGAETKDVVVATLDGLAPNADAVPTYTVNNTYNFAGTIAYMGDDSILNGAYEGYALYRVFTKADGSVELDIVDTTNVVEYVATGADIVKGSSIMAVSATEAVIVDHETVFTVMTDYTVYKTYTQYVGKANVPTMTNCTVFYVDNDADQAAEYVYVKAGTPDYTGKAFVMATSPAYYTMYNNDTTYYVLKNALVDGVAVEDEIFATVANKDFITGASGLIAKMGVPHYVEYNVGGDIKSIDAFDTTAEQVGTSNVWYVEMDNIVESSALTLVDGEGTLATNDDVTYTITDAAILGDYDTTEGVDWEFVNVYAVYHEVVVGSLKHRVVDQLYIVDVVMGDGNGGESTEPTPAPDKTILVNEINVATYTTDMVTVKANFKDATAGTAEVMTSYKYHIVVTDTTGEIVYGYANNQTIAAAEANGDYTFNLGVKLDTGIVYKVTIAIEDPAEVQVIQGITATLDR